MIFSKCKSEIYYLLSYLLKSFDIEIIQTIYDKKRELEDRETLDWYLSEGKRYKKYKEGIIINQILFNPYHETYNMFKHFQNKHFNLKILIESIGLDGFILVKEKDYYSVPLLKNKLEIINDYVRYNGILELYNKIFQYHIHLTDLEGNRCIRSIILNNDKYDKYEYNTIAIRNNEYINPVDRYPQLI